MNRYNNIKKIKNKNPNVGVLGTPYQKTVRYPHIPFYENDIYLITEFGDRLDLLADQFYKNVDDYWIIAKANPNEIKGDSVFLESGKQIRIPTDIQQIKNSFNQLNNL